jgi:hypothetical protein
MKELRKLLSLLLPHPNLKIRTEYVHLPQELFDLVGKTESYGTLVLTLDKPSEEIVKRFGDIETYVGLNIKKAREVLGKECVSIYLLAAGEHNISLVNRISDTLQNDGLVTKEESYRHGDGYSLHLEKKVLG